MDNNVSAVARFLIRCSLDASLRGTTRNWCGEKTAEMTLPHKAKGPDRISATRAHIALSPGGGPGGSDSECLRIEAVRGAHRNTHFLERAPVELFEPQHLLTKMNHLMGNGFGYRRGVTDTILA